MRLSKEVVQDLHTLAEDIDKDVQWLEELPDLNKDQKNHLKNIIHWMKASSKSVRKFADRFSRVG